MILKEQRLARLAGNSAAIGIFGLGYAGLPLTRRFSAVGFRVLAVDIDAAAHVAKA